MGHDMALIDRAMLSAVYGYKQRWLLDIAEPITPATIAARAEQEVLGPWLVGTFVVQWASRPFRAAIEAMHEPVFSDEVWPWSGPDRGSWTVVDLGDEARMKKRLQVWGMPWRD